MLLRKIEPDDFTSFQNDIEKSRSMVERTLNLTWFYVQARFKIPEKEFKNIYSVDGANDGGIDCYFQEGNTFYLIQSKYHERSQRENVFAIKHEIQKLEKTVIGENTNKYASDFVNALKRSLENPNAYLEIIWLSTNEVNELTRKESQEFLTSILSKRNWEISADINFIDRFALEGVIYDIKHGYVPHTGKKKLRYEPNECMVIEKERSNIESVVCNIKATEILKWFNSSHDITKYLQKNVRESVGENSINRSIRESFKNDPNLFWYKHNGIIIFADWLEQNKNEKTIVIRNPQIVNGAQTITQLYQAYDETRENSYAKVLVRIYRLPYEDSETYKRSIDIIAALNSQNKIKASDLHSTDPRQVMLENRINDLGSRYTYHRKRSVFARKSSSYQIFMTALAQVYNVCEFRKPDEGVGGAIEEYFEEEKRYDDSFPQNQIKKPLTNGITHIVFRYIDCWNLSFFIDREFVYELSDRYLELYKFIYWYLLVDVYNQLQDWKERVFNGTWREWMDFIESPPFKNRIVRYMKPRYIAYFNMLPKSEVDPRNFYRGTDGRNKFLKNSGKANLFRNEIGRAYDLFRRQNGY